MYKSRLEKKFADTHKLPYETTRLPYVSKHNYTPDFEVAKNVFIETKGRFTSADRSKIKQVLEQHPEITLALVFQTPSTLLSKTSTTTYAVWAAKNNIPWFDAKDTTRINDFIKKYQN